jgi:hypothetical protein
VESFIRESFVPVKIHIKEQPAVFDRFGVQWTPTLVIFDPDGIERHRFEGFLPAEDFLARLGLGLAHAAFAGKRWKDAEQRFRHIVDAYPKSEAAPEALYWAGVARYKGGDPNALPETARLFKLRYPESAWAKKASVWEP